MQGKSQTSHKQLIHIIIKTKNVVGHFFCVKVWIVLELQPNGRSIVSTQICCFILSVFYR